MRITRAVVAMAWVTACSPSAERNNVVDRIETQSSALTTYNGVTYNGISYAGRSLTRISGLGPNGTSLYDALAIGIRSDLVSESLYDGTLDMAMFDLTGTLEDGEEVELRINDVEINEDGRPSFSVSIGLDGQWTSLCSDSEGDERRAIAVPGVWKTISGEIGGGSWASERGAFSFACRNSSIEKCVRLGYGPEDKDFFGRPYRLLACVRMLRADYCGDGQSWTTDGRLIEAWDDDDINSRTEPDWPREAGWTPEGASCLDNPRLLFPEDSVFPFCLSRLEYTSCSSKYVYASIWNSFSPPDDFEQDGAEQVDAQKEEAKPATEERSRNRFWESWSWHKDD